MSTIAIGAIRLNFRLLTLVTGYNIIALSRHPTMKPETGSKLTVAVIFLALAGLVILASAESSRGQGVNPNPDNPPYGGYGPGSGRDDDPGFSGTAAANGARFDSQNSPGNTGSVGRPDAENPSNRDAGTSGSTNRPGGASEDGLAHLSDHPSSFRNGEEMVVIDSARERKERESSKKEHDPTFDGSGLFADISPMPSATPSRAVKPVPSASPKARPSATPRVSPIPSEKPDERPDVAPEASPTPSAPESRDVDPAPSATVSPHN